MVRRGRTLGRVARRLRLVLVSAALGCALAAALIALAFAAVTAAGATARSPQIYFTSYPGAGFTDSAALAVRPRTLQMSGDASWIIDSISWTGWGSAVAHGTGESDVDNCSPTCAGGKHLGVRSEITLSKFGEVDGHEVYVCITVTSGGPPTFARQRAQARYCLPASPAPSPAPSPGGPPTTSGAPSVSGRGNPGTTLTCSGGRLTRRATRVSYRWVRDGNPIPGAATRLYRVRVLDEGTTLTCRVIAYSGTSVIGTVSTRGVHVAVPYVSGCPAADGGSRILDSLLGVSRSEALRVFARSSGSGQADEDLFCLTPTGVLVGYAPVSLVRDLPAAERRRLTGRVIWISTANASFSIQGVAPGTALGAARAELTLVGPFRVGANSWYLARDGSRWVVLIVDGGTVSQIGVTDGALAGSHAADLALIKGLDAIDEETLHVSPPLQVLDDYWADIGARNFAGAFGYVAPGLIGSKAAFVSSEQNEMVESAQFHGQMSAESGPRATVRVVSLITHDQEFGCRTWSGSYTMVERPQGWRITRADIEPRSCGG